MGLGVPMWHEDSTLSADEADDLLMRVDRLVELCDDLAVEVSDLELGGVPGPVTGYVCQARGALNLAAAALTEFTRFRNRTAAAVAASESALSVAKSGFADGTASEAENGTPGSFSAAAAGADHPSPCQTLSPVSGSC